MPINVNANPVGNPVIVSSEEQTADATETEYKRFEELTREIAHTPKPLADDKRRGQ
jgi:hypothetical protein